MSSDKPALMTFLVLLFLAAPVCAAGTAQDPEIPDFSGTRAMEWLVRQCDLGPRIPGTPGHAQLRRLILEQARSNRLSAAELCFTAEDPRGTGPIELCNIVVSAGPAGGERLWLGAHFDSRPFSDRDPDPAKRDQPLPGANDGASGTAILLQLMEIFGRREPSRGVDLLFLDGEDLGSAGRPDQFCLGSAHLAETWQDFGNPLATGEPEGVIILDMVGDKDLLIPMEQYSLRYSGPLLEMIFDRARRLGLEAFRPEPGPAVYDDHLPFIRAGLPAVDLIDFDYPAWHTTADTPSACSAASLGQVGTLLVDLLFNP